MDRTAVEVRGVRLSALIEGEEAGPRVTFAHPLATDLTLCDEQARAALVPGARLVEIGAAGHPSNLEQPAARNAARSGFLGSLEGRP